MTPEEIRLELFKRRKWISMAKIARSLKCSPQAVGAVIDRKVVSNRIMMAVSNAIGRTKEDVWPDYYLKN